MKIAFFVESMVLGGAEKALIDLVNHMDHSRYEITVIAIFKNSVYDLYAFHGEEHLHSKVRFKWLIDNSSPLKYKLFNHLYAHCNKTWLYSCLVKEKYDVEIAWYEGLPTIFVANSGNRSSRKYAWLHTDNERLYSGVDARLLERTHAIYKRFTDVVGVSNRVCRSFRSFFPDIHTRTVYNFFDADMIEKLSRLPCNLMEEDGPIFLTVGRLTHVKGFSRLIDVLSEIKKKGYTFRLVMLGGGEEREEIEKKISRYGLGDDVRMIGMTDNPFSYMKNSTYLVCSSYYEGFGNVFVEAILCGLPILSVSVGGISELFEQEICGEICENSEQGLYEMICGVIEHPEKRDEYARACEKMRARFEPERQLRDYYLLFDGT